MTNLSSRNSSREFIEHARRFLRDDYLPKIRRCLESLNDDQIWWRANAESNSVGNLILHLCGNARQWIVSGLGERTDQRDRDSEFEQREVIPRTQLSELLTETMRDVDEVLKAFNTDHLLQRYQIQGSEVIALEAIFHVTEHFSMHTGQIILLTKMLAQTDLGFYDFTSGAPVHTWQR